MTAIEFTKAEPEFVTVSLPDYGLLSVQGPDTEKFLQGQLSCDLNQLGEDCWSYAAHCDQKGKTLSTLFVGRSQDRILLVSSRAALAASKAQLDKFSVFSQLEISDLSEQYPCFGVFGAAAPQQLAEQFNQPLVSADANSLFSLDDAWIFHLGEHPQQYLVLTKQVDFPTNAPEQQWQALEIERGRATLQQQTIAEFVPQMLNVHLLHGISFSKGCYIGQETIARMKYLGKQKRALFRLQGQGSEVAPGATIEQQLGDNWRRAGTVINAVSRADQQLDVLAVLPSDSSADARFRIKDDDVSFLEIHPLPYNLDES